MSYYGARGDFYTGRSGYYRAGDPGFFSSLGSIFKKVVPIAASFIPGVGGIAAQALAGGLGGGGGSAPQQPSISGAGVASREGRRRQVRADRQRRRRARRRVVAVSLGGRPAAAW